MALSNATLVPELQYWFNRFIKSSIVNKNEVPLPVTFNDCFLPQNSFIEVLFNENFSGDEYHYLYTEDTNKLGWPEITRNRLMIYPGSAKYMRVGETGDNIFGLQMIIFLRVRKNFPIFSNPGGGTPGVGLIIRLVENDLGSQILKLKRN